MFYGCESLKYLSLSNFNTENVNNMEWMFSNTKSLTSLDLSNFFTPNIINLYGIFFGCESLKYLDISNFVIEDDTEIYLDLAPYCQIKINPIMLGKIKSLPSCDIN